MLQKGLTLAWVSRKLLSLRLMMMVVIWRKSTSALDEGFSCREGDCMTTIAPNRFADVFGYPKGRAVTKLKDYMTPYVQAFIRQAPFVIMATSDADGTPATPMDVSSAISTMVNCTPTLSSSP